MRITNWSIGHSTTIFVLMFIIVVLGLSSYNSLPRESTPDIEVPYVIVTTIYFGVSPQDMETLITNPIEEELEQIKDVRIIRSTSAESASMIMLEFEPTVDMDEALQRVRDRVDAAESEIPEDAEEPIITEVSFADFPIMVVNVAGEVGLSQLSNVAEELQDRLETVDGVLDVNLVGGVERVISVDVDPDLLDYYGLALGEIINAVQAENVNIPGGSIDVGDYKLLVRIPGEFERIDEIEGLIVRNFEDHPIYVRDVAQVRDEFEDQETYSRLNGVTSVSLTITRRTGSNMLDVTDGANAVVDAFSLEIGESIQFTVLSDQSDEIRSMVADLENNIMTGLILVILLQFMFMGGVRNAVFVAIAIPMSMLITFVVLAMMGITLNMIVLFSLILALGMLVDNAIVVVENIYRNANLGKPMKQAARDGVKEVAWPVVASTGTTIAAFFPLMFWPGLMGSFMYYLPLTVVVVLASSLFVALVINPVVCAVFMKARFKEGETAEEVDALDQLPQNFFYKTYGFLLRFALRQRLLIGIVVTVVFIGTFSLYGKNNAGVEFLPAVTPERLVVNVSLPDGATLDASDRIVGFVEEALAGGPNMDNWVANVGSGTAGGMSFTGSNTPHLSNVTIDLLDIADQVEHPAITIERIREHIEDVPGARFEVVEETMGPPTGYPVNVELVGEDYDVLGELAVVVGEVIEGVDGAVDVKDDFETGRAEVAVRVDREQAWLAGANTRDIAFTVRMAVYGLEASVFREGDDEYDIVVRLSEEGRDDIEDLGDLVVPTMTGGMIPLSELAEIDIQPGYGSIRHIDGESVVTVSADAALGENANALLARVMERLDEEVVAPAGTTVRFTGASEMQDESQAFLGKALMAALFLIALILITQFNSVSQPTIIMTAVTLSVLGVFWMLMARDKPFTVVMTGMAIISLAGVVVNNSIVLISFINQEKAKGFSSKDAVYRAGMMRLRPVLLTAITTSSSLLPTLLGYNINFRELTISSGGSSVEFWEPLANAVVAGLVVAAVLTLIVVPVMYSAIDSAKALPGRIKGRFGKNGPELPVEESPAEVSS